MGSIADLIALAQVVGSLGIGAGGIGVLKWGFQVETRLLRLELANKVTK